MNKGTENRLRRLERRDGTAELWLCLGDGFARNAQTGVTMPEDVFGAQNPAAFSFTFNLERAEPDPDA